MDILAWDNDPFAQAAPTFHPVSGTPIPRPVPPLGGNGPLAVNVVGTGAAPKPGRYAVGSAEFRYWTAAEAMRRASDFWAPLLPAGKRRWHAGVGAALPMPGQPNPLPRSRRRLLASFDAAEAEAAPGVALVMTHRNAPKIKAMAFFDEAGKAAAGDNLPIFQDNRVHWNGQPVAVVLAETQEQSNHAKILLWVIYEEAPAVTAFA